MSSGKRHILEQFPFSEMIEDLRIELPDERGGSRKRELGQFMTPAPVAEFMAAMFPESSKSECRLLDAGAGEGSLTCAFIDRWAQGGFGFQDLDLTAFEIDYELADRLKRVLAQKASDSRSPIKANVFVADFIEEATGLAGLLHRDFTHAILNPPYKKINSESRHRHRLRRLRIETVNLYSAFVALALKCLAPFGHLVAIIPRSFCNGPYYRPFRELLLAESAIHRVHLFGARDRAFKEDGVLQENVIILLERRGIQGDVVVSWSTDDSFADLQSESFPFGRIVFPSDSEHFIHIPTSRTAASLEQYAGVRFSLKELGIAVSTGPIVDFRLRDHLRTEVSPDTVPLLYPGHFQASGLCWPSPKGKKPNAILRNAETAKWLLPCGHYCTAHRFTSKEQPRRVIANVVDPRQFDGAEFLGFENHLNVFHEGKRGLTADLARGLSLFMNTTAFDLSFRRFSGHTQVNATDLRGMSYPSREALVLLGQMSNGIGNISQGEINQLVGRVLA